MTEAELMGPLGPVLALALALTLELALEVEEEADVDALTDDELMMIGPLSE